MKISLHGIRETKEFRMVLHIRVYRKKDTLLRYTFLIVRNLSDFSFCYRLSVAYLCTKSGGGGKWTCFSCRRFLLSAPVCIVPCRLDIFSTHFCAHGLPFFISFLSRVFEMILQNLQSCRGALCGNAYNLEDNGDKAGRVHG